MDTIINIGNGILNFVQDKGKVFISLLPTSPFRSVIDQINNIPFLSYINWFLPLDFVVGALMAWVTAITVYYAYMLILRWIKAID